MASSKRWFANLSLAMGLAVAGLGHAAEDTSPVGNKELLAEIEAVIHDEEKKAAAIRAGKDRSLFCSNCHGETGNSQRPDIPNLAEQNPTYLLEQIGKFADGRRKNFVMQTLAKDFTMEDKVNLAVYFSQSELQPQESDPVLASRGQPIFKSTCVFCHGEDGRGEAGYARLAGQRPLYVENTLKRFRANARDNTASYAKVRSSQRMEQVAQNLSDEDIKALAAYIASLK